MRIDSWNLHERNVVFIFYVNYVNKNSSMWYPHECNVIFITK